MTYTHCALKHSQTLYVFGFLFKLQSQTLSSHGLAGTISVLLLDGRGPCDWASHYKHSAGTDFKSLFP